VTSKRRLPVLQTSDEEGGSHAAPPRARWEWIAFGAGMIFMAWLPLAVAVRAIAVRWSPEGGASELLALVVLPLLSTGFAFALGGFVLGRFGQRGWGDAASSATLAIVGTIGLTWLRFGFAGEGLFAVLLAVPAAVLGASLGKRGRGSIPPS
jgi:hypothetical protein